MEVARTSMIHSAAPHFLWPFAVRYAAHQLNLWPHVSEPETSPTLRWTGKFVDASVFRVWGTLSLVRDANASKLSSRTLRCVFLGFPTDAPPWQLYHPRSRRVFSSQDVTFDESDYFYRLHPHASHPTEGEGSGGAATRGADFGGAASPSGGGAVGDPVGGPGARHPQQPGLVETLSPQQIRARIVRRESPGGGGYGPAGAGAASPRGTAGAGGAGGTAGGAGGAAGAGGTAGGAGGAAGARGAGGTARGAGGVAGTGGTAGRAGGAAGAGGTRGAAGAGGAGAASPGGTGGAGGAGGAGATSPGGSTSNGGARAASPGGPAGAGGAGAAHAGGAGGTAGDGGAGAGGTGGAGAAGLGGARTGGTGAVGAGGAAGARGAGAAGAEGARGATGTGGAGGATGAGGARAEGIRGARAAKAGGAAGAGGAGGATGAAGTRGAGGTTGARGAGAAGARGVAGARGAGGATGAAGAGGAGAAGVGRAGAAGTAPRRLFFYPQPHSSLPPPARSFARPVSAIATAWLPAACTAPHTEVNESLTECHELETRASTPVGARRVVRPRPPTIPGTHGMALRPSSVPQRVVLPEPPVSSLPHVPDPESDLAHAAIPTVTRLLAPIIADPDFESTAAFALVTELFELECLAAALPHFASMLLCPEGDPNALDIPTPRSYAEAIAGTYVDEVPPPGANIVDGMWIFRGVNFFHNFSPTPKMTTLWVLLHVAAQRDYELHFLDISTAFLQGSLHEEIWLRRPPCFTGTTLAALGFAPSSAHPSLFLRTDTTLPPFYVLVYLDDLVFATANTEALALMKAELQERHTCTDLGPSALRLPVLLATAHSSVYRPLALSSTFRRVRDLAFVIGLHLQSWLSWRSTHSSYVLGSSCEAEIYTGAMAAQELRLRTYLLTDLGERPHSPPVLYVENKAMLALCRE
ncbi:unnamed protein product [Closterium sp. NIES-53]